MVEEIIKAFKDKYEGKLDGLKYSYQEIINHHGFFWQDEEGSTRMVGFYEEKGIYLFTDNNKELKNKFCLNSYEDPYDEMIQTKSPNIVLEILEYEVNKRTKTQDF